MHLPSAFTAAISLGLVAFAPAVAGAVPQPASVPSAAFVECGDYDGISALGSPLETVAGTPKQGTVRIRHIKGDPAPATVTSTDVGLPAAGIQFGHATATAALNSNDSCTDVVVGVPGANNGAGAVALIPGSENSLGLERAIILDGSAVGIAPGDNLGAAVTTVKVEGGVIVVAGAPNHDLPGAKDAGAIVTWLIPAGGAAGAIPTPNAPKLIVQGAGGLAGKAEKGDHFGAVLAQPSQWGTSVLTVGIPDEDIASASDAGAVAQLFFTGDAVTSNTLVWQGSGMPGSKAKGDRFGAAVLAPRGQILAIGIPGKDVSGRKDAGAVVVRDPAGEYRVVTQNTKGVPDAAEKGDSLGSALGVAFGYHGPETTTVLVGVPGEDVGKALDRGSVLLIDTGSEATALTYATQTTSGLQKNDRYGQTIAVVGGDTSYDEDMTDTALVGAPGSKAAVAGDYYWTRASGITRWESDLYFATRAG